MTRAAPARLLGLTDRGHLGAGAIADVAVYDDAATIAQQMFRAAALVFKDGDLVVRDGAVTHYRFGRALTVRPEHDARDRPPHDATTTTSATACPTISSRCRSTAFARPDPFELRAMRALTVNGIRIDDTFAEAFGMRATALVITADTRALGAAGGGDDDRLRHLGDRLRLRGRHRSRAAAARDAGRAARRARAAVRGLDQPNCRSSCRTASASACSPARARPAMRASTARSSCGSATRCATSATAGRFPSASAAGATGACR